VAVFSKEIKKRSYFLGGEDSSVECVLEFGYQFLLESWDEGNLLGVPIAIAPKTILSLVVGGLFILGNSCKNLWGF
jgi:hypothetical protein